MFDKDALYHKLEWKGDQPINKENHVFRGEMNQWLETLIKPEHLKLKPIICLKHWKKCSQWKYPNEPPPSKKIPAKKTKEAIPMHENNNFLLARRNEDARLMEETRHNPAALLDVSLQRQKNILAELPGAVVEALSSVLEDMLEEITQKKAPHDHPMLCGGNGHFNLIPSNKKGACHPFLVTLCYDRDNFHGRILETLNHLTLHCPGRTQQAYVITTQWQSGDIKNLAGYIASVKQNGAEVYFLYVTGSGVNMMLI